MADGDIRADYTIIRGVNSENCYVQSEAHRIDGGEHSAVLAVGTHKLFDLPAGVAVTGIKVASLTSAASTGTATAKFSVVMEGSTVGEDLCSAIGKADLAAGDVSVFDTTKIKTYEKDKVPTITLTVGTAAFTTLDLFVVVEYVPIQSFLTNG